MFQGKDAMGESVESRDSPGFGVSQAWFLTGATGQLGCKESFEGTQVSKNKVPV